jgi:hypothetical protein
MGSAIPLCRWPFPRLCGVPSPGFAGHRSASRRTLSSSFAFLQSITQQILAGLPQRASSSHGLLVPTAHKASKVHLPQALPARYVPSSGFDYPLDGLLPSIPRRLCFAPAALMGFALRSVSLGRYPPRFHRDEPTCRFSCRYTQHPRVQGRPSRPRFLGFDPPESLRRSACG